jgi:hypothetical protein
MCETLKGYDAEDFYHWPDGGATPKPKQEHVYPSEIYGAW